MRSNHALALVLVGAMLSGATGVAVAQSKGGADAVKARQDHMKALGADAKIIGDQLKTDAPDTAAIAAAGKRMADTSKDLPTWFPAGSGQEAGVKTRALPEIWTQPADFKPVADKAVTEIAEFSQVASAGDTGAIKTQAKQMTDACGGCHTKFRAKEQPATKPPA